MNDDLYLAIEQFSGWYVVTEPEISDEYLFLYSFDYDIKIECSYRDALLTIKDDCMTTLYEAQIEEIIETIIEHFKEHSVKSGDNLKVARFTGAFDLVLYEAGLDHTVLG